MLALRILYLAISVWLSVYGFNAFVLILMYLRRRRTNPVPPALSEYPMVTVQLPLYNERYVVRRAISALARLDWPRERLQVQVLDDSTDMTTSIARRCIARYRRQGINMVLLHRTNRSGFKAGALNDGMESATGEFVAIFDADFVPAPDFLRRTVPYLIENRQLGFVQARWGHLNDGFSLLTLAQAIGFDGHFAIEHTARERAGWMTIFNGTCGVWRSECIRSCGGWDATMLTEDLDLSFRAQLAGWQGQTLLDVTVPGELPVQLAALKQQQFRWAKGITQCLLRRAGLLLRGPIPWSARIEALLQVTSYLSHALMLVAMLLILPLTWYNMLPGKALAVPGLAAFGPPLLYIFGQRALYPDWWRRLRALPVLILLGPGLALNSAVAVVEALLGIKTAFERTPKFRIEGDKGEWRDRSYALLLDNVPWGEMLCTLYAVLIVVAAIERGNIAALPFLLLYVIGFGFVSAVALIQGNRRKRRSLRSLSARHDTGL